MIPDQKILFIANNPGGLKALLPVHCELPQSQFFITPGLTNTIKGHPLPHQCLSYELSSSQIEDFLKINKPHLLITGTSVPTSDGGKLENIFRQCAKRNKIPSLSIIDHWSNYTSRFTLKDNLDSLPDIICVMDERAKQEMIADGFLPDILRVTGQPAFDGLQKIASELEILREETRTHFQLPKTATLIGFVSEPVSADYGHQRGYDEFDVLKNILNILPSDFILGVRLHPRDNPQKYDDLFKNTTRRILIMNDCESKKFLAASDLLIGMTSVMLIEAYLVGRPVLSFQPTTQVNAPFIKTIAPVQLVTSIQELEKYLHTPPTTTPQNTFLVDGSAALRVAKTARELL